MSHGKITFDVDGETVGPGQSAREIDEYADLRGRAVGVARQAPDLVGAGHRQVEVLLVRRENEAVWARHRVDQAVELTIGSQPLDAPRRVLHSELGRANVCTPVPNPQLVCRLLLEQNKQK